MNGKVIWHMTMSLDGYIAGRDHDLNWMSERTGTKRSAMADEVIATTGAFMAGGWGATLYDGTAQTRPYGGAWTGPIFLLTHRDPATTPDPAITYLSGDIRAAVETGLRAANGKNLVVTGASVPRQCVAAGLVDEIVLHVIPVLLGDGIRFFESPGSQQVNLDLVDTETEPGISLRFRVVK